MQEKIVAFRADDSTSVFMIKAALATVLGVMVTLAFMLPLQSEEPKVPEKIKSKYQCSVIKDEAVRKTCEVCLSGRFKVFYPHRPAEQRCRTGL